MEGITGGNIVNIPDDYMVADVPAARLDGKPPKVFLQDLEQKLKARPRVLIGHNCFTDFANLYKCFIGPLPDTVERFASEIHDLFPGVVDTKSLASFGHKRWGNTSLEDVEMDLRSQETPKIHVPAEYDRYTHASRYHEAGYDSLLTAKIAIKLSAKLEREQEYIDELKQPEGDLELMEFGAEQDEFHETSAGPDFEDKAAPRRTLTQETDVTPLAVRGAAVAVKERTHPSTEVEKIKKTLEKINLYEVLEADTEGPGPGSSIAELEAIPLSSVSRSEDALGLDLVELQKKGEIMPRWDNTVFWTLFGNKLQVNGSKEGVCKLE